MCAWDTTEGDVKRFVEDLKRMIQEAPRDIDLGNANHRKL